MNDKPTLSRRLSQEEILDQIHEMAREGEGVDARWALKMLSAQAGTVGIPEPLHEGEALIRLARMMYGYGRDVSAKAFKRAFSKDWEEWLAVGEEPNLAPGEILPTTLEEYWDRWPHLRHPVHPTRIPKGYPYKGTPEEKKAWVKKRALYQIRREMAEAKRHKKAGTDATQGRGQAPGPSLGS